MRCLYFSWIRWHLADTCSRCWPATWVANQQPFLVAALASKVQLPYFWGSSFGVSLLPDMQRAVLAMMPPYWTGYIYQYSYTMITLTTEINSSCSIVNNKCTYSDVGIKSTLNQCTEPTQADTAFDCYHSNSGSVVQRVTNSNIVVVTDWNWVNVL